MWNVGVVTKLQQVSIIGVVMGTDFNSHTLQLCSLKKGFILHLWQKKNKKELLIPSPTQLKGYEIRALCLFTCDEYGTESGTFHNIMFLCLKNILKNSLYPCILASLNKLIYPEERLNCKSDNATTLYFITSVGHYEYCGRLSGILSTLEKTSVVLLSPLSG